MSELFKKAVVDAKKLRETAREVAEREVLEKVMPDIKSTMDRIISEQMEDEFGMEDPMGEMPPPAPAGDPFGDEIEGMSNPEFAEDIPGAATSEIEGFGDDEEIVLDLDQLVRLADVESEDEEDMIDTVDMIEELPPEEEDPGLPGEAPEMPSEMPEAEDDIELGDSSLWEELEEELDVDVEPTINGNMGRTQDEVEDAIAQQRAQEKSDDYFEEPWRGEGSRKTKNKRPQKPTVVGLDNDFLQEVKNKLDSTTDNIAKEFIKQIKESKKLVRKEREKLIEIKGLLRESNLSNAKLIYENHVLKNPSLNERQKERIVDAINEADSVNRVKDLYEANMNAVANPRRQRRSGPSTLDEAAHISETRTLVYGAKRPKSTEDLEKEYQRNKWQKIAGIKKE